MLRWAEGWLKGEADLLVWNVRNDKSRSPSVTCLYTHSDCASESLNKHLIYWKQSVCAFISSHGIYIHLLFPCKHAIFSTHHHKWEQWHNAEFHFWLVISQERKPPIYVYRYKQEKNLVTSKLHFFSPFAWNTLRIKLSECYLLPDPDMKMIP